MELDLATSCKMCTINFRIVKKGKEIVRAWLEVKTKIPHASFFLIQG